MEASQQRVYVTFLDMVYVPKLLVTLESLQQVSPQAMVYVHCFDDESYQILRQFPQKNMILVHYKDFETPALMATKKDKKRFYEYYWAYKPELILQTMAKTNAEIVTYIDCDFYFFSDPEILFQDMGDVDVLIQPNNFSQPEAKQFLPVGYYCSCFEAFRNNPNGKKVLRWWLEQCTKWCFSEFEDGKFADQKYLDDWRTRFSNVREITHIGANVAPWNVQKYSVTLNNGQPMVNNVPILYYHYHSFRMNTETFEYIVTGDRENHYQIFQEAVDILYPPYAQALKKTLQILKKIPEYQAYSQKNPESQVVLQNPNTVQFNYREKLQSL